MRPTKVPVWLILLALFAIALAACGSPPAAQPPASTAPEQADTAAPAAAADTGPVRLRIFLPSGTPAPEPSADPLKQALDSALGTDIEMSVAGAEDYVSQLNVRLAGGDAPDIFQVNRASLSQFAQLGQLLDLTPYLDQLGVATEAIGAEALAKGQYNGQQFGLPKRAILPYYSYWIRQDWLDALGLAAPTTLDELRAVAVAFTEQDPDGNGRDDTYGITGGGIFAGPGAWDKNTGANAFAPIFGAHGVGTPGSFYLKDGALTSAYDDPGMAEALAFIRDLVAAGAVEPEFAANVDVASYRDKAIQGQAGIVYAAWSDFYRSENVEQIKAVNPNAEWVQLAPPEGPGGQFAGTYDIGASPGILVMPRSLEREPEKIARIAELFNYVSAGPGATLTQFGVEGSHYTLEGGAITPTELLSKEGGYFFLYQLTGRPDLEYLQTRFAAQEPYFTSAAAQPFVEGLNGFLTIPEGYVPADAERFAQEQLLAFIQGGRPLEEYAAFIEELDTTFSYQLYRDAAQQQLAAAGVLR